MRLEKLEWLVSISLIQIKENKEFTNYTGMEKNHKMGQMGLGRMSCIVKCKY